MATTAFRGFMPTLEGVFTLPEPFDNSARIMRIHNKALKLAMQDTLHNHWRTRIPKHFQHAAKSKYRHHPRAAKTKEIKEMRGRGFIPDLVGTRRKPVRTRDYMKNTPPSIRIGGSGSKGYIRGTMTLRFPPGFRSAIKATGVTRAKMADEISRWTPQEEEDAAKFFGRRYVHHMRVLMKNRPQLRRQFNNILAGS